MLAVTTDVSLAELSSEPADYPRSTYGAPFLDRATSSFIMVDYSFPPRVLTFSYPEILLTADDDQEVERSAFIGRRQVFTLRAIFEVAGLDEDTATMDDLDDVGERFCWLESPVWKKEKEVFRTTS